MECKICGEMLNLCYCDHEDEEDKITGLQSRLAEANRRLDYWECESHMRTYHVDKGPVPEDWTPPQEQAVVVATEREISLYEKPAIPQPQLDSVRGVTHHLLFVDDEQSIANVCKLCGYTCTFGHENCTVTKKTLRDGGTN